MLTYALVVNAMISTACTSPMLSLARLLLALPVVLPVAATFAVLGRCFKHNRSKGPINPQVQARVARHWPIATMSLSI